MSVILLFVGFILLISGANFFVDGSSALAKALRIPAVVIGLTIVAIGTSAPEASVSIAASIKGNSDISVSNIIGSNLFNLFFIVGLCATIKNLPLDKNLMKRDFPFCIIASVALLLCCLGGTIRAFEGIVFFAMITFYLVFIVRSSLKHRDNYEIETDTNNKKKKPLWLDIIYILGGIIAIVYGGNIVVDNACEIAKSIGVSDTLVGLTIVAVGTSLPELVTSLVAIKKGENGLAVGNVVGSNIFNILAILGVSASIFPIAVSFQSIVDTAILATATIILFLITYKKSKVTRAVGISCIIFYLTYMIYAVIR